MSNDAPHSDRERIARYAENNPDADPTQILGALVGDLESDLADARALVEDVLAGEGGSADRRSDGTGELNQHSEGGDPGVLVKDSDAPADPVDSPEGTADADRVRHTSAEKNRESETPDGEDTADPDVDGSGTGTFDHKHDPSEGCESPETAGEDRGSGDATPGVDTEDPVETDGGEWDTAEFADPDRRVWADELESREQWMARAGESGKQPFSPWADRDHPDADPDDDARWKWGLPENHAPKDVVDMVQDDPRVEGWAFIQRADDPLAFVDGDDVRDDETGEVHPAFVRILERLGVTYADVSTSGAGVHAYYLGDLPDGIKQGVSFALDTEPWGANDDVPEVEIYDGKHVCVATGEHVPGTPTDVREWDPDALESILDEHDQLPEDPTPTADRPEFDVDEYDPDATAAGETASDIRDCYAALDRLDARRVADATIVHSWNEGASTSGDNRAFVPTWGPGANGTANIVDREIWQDTGGGGYGGPVVMALLDLGEMRPDRADPKRATGATWIRGYEHLQNLGFSLPDLPSNTPPGEDVDPVAVLPNSPKARALSGGWDWTVDDRHTRDDALTIDAARERTVDTIADAYDYADTVLVEALPTMGKSYGAVLAAARTGQHVTILTGRGRNEQYEQYREWADEHALDVYTLPAFTEDCPTAAGAHGDDLADRVRDWYARGATPKEIHKNAEYELGEPLPCQHEGTCPYTRKWDFDPDEFDVLLGHYTHAHKRKVTGGRTVVFDEFPGQSYETELHELLAPAVSHYLQATDALPFDDYADLWEHRNDDERRETALEHFEDADLTPDELQVFESETAHAHAPLATYAILAGEDLGNGWERATLGDGRIGLVDRNNARVRILSPPPLGARDGVRNVVALDGTPTKRMWELALGHGLNHKPVLSEDERAEYLADVLGHRYIRTTEYVKPYNSEGHVSVDRDAALLEGIVDEHGQKPALVTTATAERKYRQAGILPDVDDGETEGDLATASKHYGDVLGSNEFKRERLGAVIGSNHYGDGYIKKWGAYAGSAVERAGDGRGADLTYTGIGDDVLQHMREHDTLQAAMRFGRDGNGAVVYVHTDTLPDWVPLAGEGRVTHVRGEGERQVLDALQDLDGRRWTTAEIVAHPTVDVGERQVLKHLHALNERGVLDRARDPEDGRRYVWRDDGLHRVGEHGDVALDTVDVDALADDEISELSRTTIYTWEFGNSPPTDGETPPGATDPDRRDERAVANGGDPPSPEAD